MTANQLITTALLFVLGVPVMLLLIGAIYGGITYWLDNRD